MQNWCLLFLQLTFYMVVYCCAHRVGYRTAQSRIETILREINRPLHKLFDRTYRDLEILGKEDRSEGE